MAKGSEGKEQIEWFDEIVNTKMSNPLSYTLIIGGSHNLNRTMINKISELFMEQKVIFLNFDKYIGLWKEKDTHDP